MTSPEPSSARGPAPPRYRTADGARVPGVTTVLGVLAKPALVPWANRLGLRGINVATYVDETAAIGALVHQLIASDLAGTAADLRDATPAQLERAQPALAAFHDWRGRHILVPERIEWPLVSEQHRFGGTLDCTGTLDGRRTLLDFKTSGAIYPEHRIQVAAYAELLREHGAAVAEVRILRLGRTAEEGCDDCVLVGVEVAAGWAIFQHALAIYGLLRDVRGAAA